MRRLRRGRCASRYSISVCSSPRLVTLMRLGVLGFVCRRAPAWPSPGRRRTPSSTTPTSRYDLPRPRVRLTLTVSLVVPSRKLVVAVCWLIIAERAGGCVWYFTNHSDSLSSLEVFHLNWTSRGADDVCFAVTAASGTKCLSFELPVVHLNLQKLFRFWIWDSLRVYNP
jgi:hypothetical protein